MSKTSDMAKAMPTKRFFVSMLTRDISLDDAILDLVDNCLDGALRAADGEKVDYSQYSITIKLSSDRFYIKDDCGGIPRDIAKNYAFKMGREPDDVRDSDSETIGMYGVGMKRAIFKMGTESIVKTRHDKDAFEVPISSDWLNSKEWEDLPIIPSESSDLEKSGTQIVVNKLFPGVSRHFENGDFINNLQTSIGEHFTTFLKRGLKIYVNGVLIKPVLIEVLVSSCKGGPFPYVFKKEIDGVTISIAVGLNTGRNDDIEDDNDGDFERERSAATAGWTVFCNDRAVIVGDKTRLTGWGDGIPMYHGQFSIITGIIEFRSALADKLPITTTKRALDSSSDIWLEAKTKMREGLRVWINYTNQWKNHPRSDYPEPWKSAAPLPLSAVFENVIRLEDVTTKKDGSLEYNPQKNNNLPVPESKKPSSRKIVFSRPLEEIRTVSSTLFETENENAGLVGARCFELVLEQIQQEEE